MRLFFNLSVLTSQATSRPTHWEGLPKERVPSIWKQSSYVCICIPRCEREDLDLLTHTLSLDVPSRPYPTPFLDQLLESAREEQWVAVTYHSENGVSQQTLLPMRVRTEAGLWYCEAYSSERKATRVYRVDRFLEVRAAPSPPQWERPASTIPREHPSFPEVRIHLTARGVLRLESNPHLGPRLQQKGGGEGWLSLRWRPEEYDWLVGCFHRPDRESPRAFHTGTPRLKETSLQALIRSPSR
jgi:hypothetical protein